MLHVTLDSIVFGLQRYGGISNYWTRLIREVRCDREIASTLLLPSTVKYREFDDPVEQCGEVTVEGLPASLARYLRAPTPLGCEVFHTSYYRLPARNVPRYVVSVYDFTYERYRRGFARLVHNRQKVNSIARADAVVCISESTKKDVLEFCPNVSPASVHVVHLGVDPSAFFPERVASGGLGEDRVVLFVGQRNGYKRFDLAVDAVRQCEDLTLGIVGPSLSEDERGILRQRLGRRWAEYGPVPLADLRRRYSSAFAFIFPSDYEGFGLPILEAMACGCPVVASDRSSFPEVGGEAAIYAVKQEGGCYAEALLALESAVYRSRVVEKGLDRVKQFTWETTYRRTREIYFGG